MFSGAMPRVLTSSCSATFLSSRPCIRCVIFRSFMRFSVSGELRPVMTATVIPAAISCFSPSPSRILNPLSSSPFALKWILPSLMMPSTSRATSLMPAAFPSRDSGQSFCSGLFSSSIMMPLICSLDHASAKKVVHIDCTNQGAVCIGYRQGTDFKAFHHVKRFCRQLVWLDGSAVACHHVSNRGDVYIYRFIQSAAQVPIGENACHGAIGIHHCGHAKSLTGNFKQGSAQCRVFIDDGYTIAGVHYVRHPEQQLAAKAAAGVGECKIFCAEAPRLQQGNG